MVIADKVLFCFPCRQRLLSVCQITDFQIDDILNPSKKMHFNRCVSWGGGCQVLFLFDGELSLAFSLYAQARHKKSHLTNLLAILVLYCHTQLLL